MKNTLKFLGAAMLTASVFVSCSNDDDAAAPIVIDIPGVTPQTRLFATSNGSSSIVNYNITDLNNITAKSFTTPNMNADGVFYDPASDFAVIANRSSNTLDAYTGINANNDNASVTPAFSTGADLMSPREVTVNGDFYVVADNADADGDPLTPDGRFFIYVKNGNSFTLRNTVTVGFKVWSGVFIGNNFYAVVDTTGDLAVFNNFLTANTTDATVMPNKRIAVEGIVRTHGIAYDASSGVGIMTDIGTVGVPGAEADGGFHVISNFESKVANVPNGGLLTVLNNQIRVSGSNTMLGNPVDVAYDGETGVVYIAEAANSKVLAFNNVTSGGNLTPVVANDLMGASAVHLSKE